MLIDGNRSALGQDTSPGMSAIGREAKIVLVLRDRFCFFLKKSSERPEQKQLLQENQELREENARLRQNVELLRQKMDLLIRLSNWPLLGVSREEQGVAAGN